MSADLIAFVDSIATSPTVRLNLNDNSPWRCPEFNAPPPRLRRSTAVNAMRDGGLPGTSNYDMRTVTMVLDLSGTQDAQASQIQLLARELDRADNFLKYQPNGLTKPVFFKVFRSNVTELEDKEAQSAKRRLKVELLCDSFALGLRETLGPYTVNNDPAHATNGCYFDVTGVIGDVVAPAVIVNTATQPFEHLCVRQSGTPSTDMSAWFRQAESCTLGTDTTNPGGGPDAAMSGAGANNFARTSFATATWQTRLTWAAPGVNPGTYRLLAVVRRSDNTSAIQARFNRTTATGGIVTIPLTTDRQVVDLGLVAIDSKTERVGYGPPNTVTAVLTQILATRTSGAGTIDWDFLALFPADEQTLIRQSSAGIAESVLDGVLQTFGRYNSGDPLAGGAAISEFAESVQLAGTFPHLAPGRTNRFYMMTSQDLFYPGRATVKSDAGAVTLHYWPQYLSIRPSAT